MLKFSVGLQGFVLLLFYLVGWEGQALGQVQGTATYRERLALPPDAAFEATLEDVSKVMPAEVKCLARPVSNAPGNPPIRFEITTILHASIRATVTQYGLASWLAGELFFSTDRHCLVLTGGHGNEVALLRRAGPRPVGGGAGALGDFCPLPCRHDLPCADCPGIRHQLELFPDQAFFLRMTYLGRVMTPASMTSVAGPLRAIGALVLSGGREAPLKFAIKDANTLRQLDLEGREIASSRNDDLRRTQDLQPLEPRLLDGVDVQVLR